MFCKVIVGFFNPESLRIVEFSLDFRPRAESFSLQAVFPSPFLPAVGDIAIINFEQKGLSPPIYSDYMNLTRWFFLHH